MIHPERRRENLMKIEEMDKREKIIKGVESCIKMGRLGVENCREFNCPYFENGLRLSCWIDVLSDVLELLKEQDSEKERIMKVIWDVLHEGFSIDTIADQDWVYEQMRHRIEDI